METDPAADAGRVLLALRGTTFESASLRSRWAAIQGAVRNTSGAVILGATIAATNTETNLQRSVTSNAAGLYAISNLPPGKYRVQVTIAGFQTDIRENVWRCGWREG